MTMDTSPYLDRVYGQPPCWELVADVYATEFGSDVGRYAVTTGTIREAAQKFALHIATDPHGFIRLTEPTGKHGQVNEEAIATLNAIGLRPNTQ